MEDDTKVKVPGGIKQQLLVRRESVIMRGKHITNRMDNDFTSRTDSRLLESKKA